MQTLGGWGIYIVSAGLENWGEQESGHLHSGTTERLHGAGVG